MRVQLRPSRPEDFAALADLVDGGPAYRVRSITALLDGEVVGIGGLIYRPNGEVWASMALREGARRYRTLVHRCGRAGMRLIKQSGARCVYAKAQPGNAAAERWLERFGFRRHAGDTFVWRRDAADHR